MVRFPKKIRGIETHIAGAIVSGAGLSFLCSFIGTEYVVLGAVLGLCIGAALPMLRRKRQADEIPEKYQTGRWEEDLGNGRKRITRRINIRDLVDNPELAKTLFED